MQINGINGSFPIHAYKAYGVTPGRPAAPQPAAPTAPIATPQRPDAYEPTSAVNQLVAGRVSQPINFDSTLNAAPQTGPAQVFQMYTRAADKIEAAVSIQIGKSIDVQA
jgi:hypothetical protein